MRNRLDRAAVASVAATVTLTLFSAGGSGAVAQERPATAQLETVSRFTAEPVVQPLPQEPTRADAQEEAAAIPAKSLTALVAEQGKPGELSRELHCLAGAIYFESKGETLAGQLAVGRVIIARSRSGRFPDSYCGVVFQRSQFSFVRGNAMPTIDKRSRGWREAAAIAQIAHAGAWRSPVEGALFFHAAHVSPGWRLTRLARVDNHVFYR